jgi:MFS family permease
MGDASAYAALFAAFGAGSVIGGIFSASRHKISPQHFVLAIFLFGTSMLATALAPTLILAILGMAVVGMFSINVLSLGNSTIQLEAAPNMRGRVMALWSVAMIGSTPIGGPIVGFVGEYFGGRWGLAIGGIATVITAYFAYKRLRDKQRVNADLPASIENNEVTIERIKVR